MRILFLNPNRTYEGTLHVDPVLTRCVGIPAKAPYLWPPMGLAYLAGYLRHGGFGVEFLDAQAENLSNDNVLKRINHDIVFLNTGTPTIKQDLSLVNKIKQLGTKTALIGTHATYFHKELINNPGVDFIVRGEPETPSLSLAKALESGTPLSGVRGLTWKRFNRPKMNTNSLPLDDLDKIPFSVRDMMPNEKYYDILAKKSPAVFAITSRGCPFSCRFCSARLYNGRLFRARTSSNVLAEAEEIREQGFRDISFIDDTFTINKNRVLDICQGLKRLDMSWRCLSRVDTVSKDMLTEMRDSGCYQIQFGAESGDPRTLERMHKGASIEQAKKTFELCDRLGIETVGFFMLGYPGETTQSIARTTSFAHELNPDFVTFNVFTPIPGSDEYETLKTHKNWSQYNFTTTSFCDIPSNEMTRIVGEAYRNYYMKPSYIIRRMRKTRQPLRIAKQNFRFWAKRSGVLWRFIRQSE